MQRANQKGTFLISSYLVLSVLGTFSLALFLKEITLYHATERTENRIKAFHMAESGIDRALVELADDFSYTGQGYTTLGDIGGYEVFVETPDPIANPDVRRITATGHAPNNSTSSYAYGQRQIIAYVDRPSESPFNFGIFSNTSIQMSGKAGTDSYNSTNGPYDPSRPGSNGDVGTNTTGSGFVAMSGNVLLNGDMVVGPNGNPSSVIQTSGNAVIEGTRSAASEPKVLNPVTVPPSLNNLGALSVSANTKTLAGGTYWYSSISITGGGRVNFTGPTTVYVTGNVSIAGNGVGTASNLPPNLEIHVQGSRSVSFSGNGDFYGAVYSPGSGVSISGNGSLFGAVVGETIQHSGDGKVHYDEALNESSSGSTGQSHLLAWTEV